MTDKAEAEVVATLPPWATLGVDVRGTDPTKMIKEAGLNWKVSKEPLFQKVTSGGSTEYRPVPRSYLLTRSNDKKILSVVGEAYKPIQNEEAISFLTSFVKAGSMTMEAMGAVKDGRHIWALANAGYEFELQGGDVVSSHLLISVPHVIGHGISVRHVSLRKESMSTFTAPLRDNGKSIRMPHLRPFDDNIRVLAERALELSKMAAEDFEERAKFLASKKAKRSEVRHFMVRLFDPKRKPTIKLEEATRPVKLAYGAIDDQPGALMESMSGTWWGALGAVAYTIDHLLGRNRDLALSNAWFGGKAAIKTKAIALATEYAKQS